MVWRLVWPWAARSWAKWVMGWVKRKAIKPWVRAPQKTQTKPVIVKRPGM